MAEEKIKSPDKLELKGTPVKGVRFGKTAAFSLIALIALVFIAVIYGIESRGTSSNLSTTSTNTNYTPATEQSKKIYDGIPDSSPAYQKASVNSTSQASQTIPALPAPSTSPNTTDQSATRLKEQRDQDRVKALTSDTAIASWPSSTMASLPSSPSPSSPSMPRNTIDAMNAAAKQIAQENDQNKQARKEDFLTKAASQTTNDYVLQTVKPALSPYELKATTVIPAALITGINSDLPGDIFAQVKEDVYDTATGRYLLIPKGTKLYGLYDSQVAYAQQRLLVTWTRLIFPDSSSINIGGMTGGDKGGYAGFKDQVDNHYARLIGSALLVSAFNVGFQISQPQVVNNNQLTPTQIGTATVGQQLTQLGIKITEKNLAIQPTIEIRPGYEFVVKVAKDIVFPSAYPNG